MVESRVVYQTKNVSPLLVNEHERKLIEFIRSITDAAYIELYVQNKTPTWIEKVRDRIQL